MRVAFNALSVNNLSGRHVLLGHLRQIARASARNRRHLLLYHAGNRDLRDAMSGEVDAVECPAITVHWGARAIWERTCLGRLLQKEGADVLFSPAGVTTAGVGIPQMALAQNPWCFTREAQRGMADCLKAWLQRRAYRQAQRVAAVMLFNSEFMRRAYRTNSGLEARRYVILHQGVDEATFEAARTICGYDGRRREILAVSAMARHKAIEDLVAALDRVRRMGIEARLRLVGPWPDAGYRDLIERRARSLQLTDAIDFMGYVSREELHRHYSEASVFCLLSRCESFGIPAVEAAAFGTPAVIADCGAAPEIAGPGGVVVAAGDIAAATAALASLLTERQVWESFSERARANAERFRWTRCSQPLVDILSENRTQCPHRP